MDTPSIPKHVQPCRITTCLAQQTRSLQTSTLAVSMHLAVTIVRTQRLRHGASKTAGQAWPLIPREHQFPPQLPRATARAVFGRLAVQAVQEGSPRSLPLKVAMLAQVEIGVPQAS